MSCAKFQDVAVAHERIIYTAIGEIMARLNYQSDGINALAEKINIITIDNKYGTPNKPEDIGSDQCELIMQLNAIERRISENAERIWRLHNDVAI